VIVVDASIAVKWTVPEPGREEALRVLDLVGPIIAPDLILPEVSNVFRTKLKKGEVSREQAEAALNAIASTIRRFVPSMNLVHDAFALSQSLDHPTYDCFYLSCALPGGRLISADERFVEKCQRGGFASFVSTADQISKESPKSLDRNLGIDAPTLTTIQRLASKLAQTFDSLRDKAAPQGSLGGVRFVNAAVYAPAFDSPPYIRLVRTLEDVDDDELAALIALGWLGRPYHQDAEWPDLFRSAQQMVAQGRAAHMRYFVAQMASVHIGLEKLQAGGAS
jgi:predicted nucleic acid-binding protein